MSGGLVLAVDSATKNNVSYWIGRDAPCGRIEDMAWDKFSLPDGADPDAVVHARLLEREPLVDRATDIDIEQQNPTTAMPAEMAERVGRRVLLAGNVRSHALARAIKAAIVARRRALGLPMPNIRFVSPRTKFSTFGLECPKTKPERKRSAVKFVRASLESGGDAAAPWLRRFETHFVDERTGKPKLDDAADARMMGMARLVRRRAGLDKIKTQ